MSTTNSPLHVYIAGPYSADTVQGQYENVEKAMQAGVALIHAGHFPFIPHLSHFVDHYAKRTEKPVAYDEWLQQDLEWMAMCDVMLVIGDSPGVKKELTYAKLIALPVYYELRDLLGDNV